MLLSDLHMNSYASTSSYRKIFLLKGVRTAFAALTPFKVTNYHLKILL